MMNNGENPRIPPARNKPLREGYNERHNFFKACSFISRDFTVFFDYGCTNCYVAELLARILPAYNSKKPAIMTDVGGSGPSVLYNAIVTGRFLASEGKSKSFAVTCGVIPDGIFLGDVTFGKSVFHKWEFISYTSGKRIKIVRLNRFIRQLKLILKQIRVNRDNENPAFAIAENANPSNVRWKAAIPLKPRIRAFLLNYVTRFPGLFDPKAKRTNVLSKIKHSINTGDAKPVKLLPRRYSPQQLRAIRVFVNTNLGMIIRVGKGPWAAPLLLTPKKPPGIYVKPVVNKQTIWRICTDYRELNKRTKKNDHPLPNVMD
jgi:hypothetical protein